MNNTENQSIINERIRELCRPYCQGPDGLTFKQYSRMAELMRNDPRIIYYLTDAYDVVKNAYEVRSNLLVNPSALKLTPSEVDAFIGIVESHYRQSIAEYPIKVRDDEKNEKSSSN